MCLPLWGGSRQFTSQWILFGLLLIVPRTANGIERWQVRFEDGAELRVNDLGEWNEPDSTPIANGRSLLATSESSPPVSSLMDLQGTLRELASSFVEFHGGDRLSGTVIREIPATAARFESAPSSLEIQPHSNLSAPEDLSNSPVRVSTRWLRKVVWKNLSENRYLPSTAWLREGGKIPFRNLRWTSQGILLLTETGLRSFNFSELAEIHFPTADPWGIYEEQLALLDPHLQSRLVQIDLRDGSRFTTSMARFQSRHWGDRKRPEAWLQLIQPAWSLDPLWVRFTTAHAWYWFDPAEPPLSWADPADFQHEAIFGESWSWQRNRNTLGGPLTVASNRYGRGFGVHGTTRLTIPLPPETVAVQARCGLDRLAGGGGSASAAIVSSTGETLFATEPLVGTGRVIDSGWLPISAQEKATPVISLTTDMLSKTSPLGADPFDIRDLVNWLEPRLRMDRSALQARLAAKTEVLPVILPFWQRTTMVWPRQSDLQFRNWLDESDHRFPCYRVLISASQPFLQFRKSLKVSSDDRWLSLVISRFANSSKPGSVQIHLDGRSCGEFEIPLRQGPIDPLPITVPLEPGADRTVEVTITVYQSDAESWWDFRSLVATADWPGIQVFYDENGSRLLKGVGEAGLQTDTTAPLSGQEALHWKGVVDVPRLFDEEIPLVDWPRLGEYRFLTWGWRGKQASGLMLQLAHEGRVGSGISDGIGKVVENPQTARFRLRKLEDRGLRHGYAYAVGTMEQVPPPLRLHPTVTPEWRVESRDVVQDFGPLLLTGFAGTAVSPGEGWIDAIILARTPQDLQEVKRRLAPKQPDQRDDVFEEKAVTRDEWGPAVARFAPQFATPTAPHGLLLKRAHRGETGCWQTQPQDNERPFLLRTVHRFPEDNDQELDLRVSHIPQQDFRLQIRVNGEQLLDQVINDALTGEQNGWANLKINLSKYRGQTALIEVAQWANGGNDLAYWKRLVLQQR